MVKSEVTTQETVFQSIMEGQVEIDTKFDAVSDKFDSFEESFFYSMIVKMCVCAGWETQKCLHFRINGD